MKYHMREALTPFLDKAFSKRPDVFYVDGFIEEIVKLPIPERLSEYREDVIHRRKTESRDYLLERCDYFTDSRICIKYETTSDLSTNVALIHPESTLYVLEGMNTFIELKEYNRKNRSISINTNNVTQINIEIGVAGSRVSTIYLTNKLEP